MADLHLRIYFYAAQQPERTAPCMTSEVLMHACAELRRQQQPHGMWLAEFMAAVRVRVRMNVSLRVGVKAHHVYRGGGSAAHMPLPMAMPARLMRSPSALALLVRQMWCVTTGM